ncbi:NAD(P)-dependent oxidoreductase [cyanobiont of Ornithocercus magnificus]|nr:NAD(P)-dependent oxidoreductase [cyanobiont of Ornithocercus magnificus]
MMTNSAASHDFRYRSPSQVRVVIFGATGYIGRFVTYELLKRGYQVIVFAREYSGIDANLGRHEVIKQFAGASVCFGDVTDAASIANGAFSEPVDVVISCLASRSGGRQDSWAIDYQATLNTLLEGINADIKHFILLSAICVQKPELAFQKAKLAFEKALCTQTKITWSIVRPTAFFKSLSAQVELCRRGSPYIMFGDGKLTSCKPISEGDLASFIVDCIQEQNRINQILPIGGPGPALSTLQQAETLFRALKRPLRTVSVPITFMDGAVGIFDRLAKLFPYLENQAEYARIGRYYAKESMLIWNEKQQCYDESLTPSTGKDTLEDFFGRVVRDGLAGQELGKAGIPGVNIIKGLSQRIRKANNLV